MLWLVESCSAETGLAESRGETPGDRAGGSVAGLISIFGGRWQEARGEETQRGVEDGGVVQELSASAREASARSSASAGTRLSRVRSLGQVYARQYKCLVVLQF